MNLLPYAHALAARQDLPIPAWLFAWGASIVLIVSFFALSAAWRKPRFEEAHWRPLGAGLSRALLGLPVADPLRPRRGLPARRRHLRRPARHRSTRPQLRPHLPLRHRLARLPVLLGAASATSSGPSTRGGRSAAPPAAGFRAIAGQRPAHLAYPERLGRWPAAIGLVAFVWLEIVYGSSGGVAVGLDPHAAAVAALVYSAYTLAMMAVFGTEEWCERGEIFSVYFGMFSQLGSFGVEDGGSAAAARSPRRPAGRPCRVRPPW